jgi:hypothetical protein
MKAWLGAYPLTCAKVRREWGSFFRNSESGEASRSTAGVVPCSIAKYGLWKSW